MKLSFRGALAAAFVLAMCAVCVRLGFWQLDRLEQRRARNAAQEAALAQPPVELDAASAAAIRRDPARFVGRRVRVRGTYAPGGEVVLRGRVHEGRPGVHLATPLAVEGGGALVLVNRGWVPSPDAATVDAARYAEPGVHAVDGILQEIPATDDGGEPSGPDGARTFRRLDRAALRNSIGPALLPLYVQQLPSSDESRRGPPVRVALPPPGEGPHLGYAVQWFSFAAIGVIGLGILLFRARRGGA